MGRIKAGELEREDLLMEKGIYEVSKYRTSINADNWSMQSTKYNCEYAWPAWFQDNHTDFGKEYYARAAPIVEQQIMLWRIDSKYRNHFILNSTAVLDGNFSRIVTLIFHINKQKIEVENLHLFVLSFTLSDLNALTQIGGEAFIVFALFNLDAVTEAP